MKIGRNDPCWCGSQKKYKKCHLHRAAAAPVSVAEGLAALGAFRQSSECNCPEQIRQECSGQPINSHTIAKSLGLAQIAVAGHVLGLKHDFSTLKRTKGKAEIGRIGVNKISVFPGFCSFHDKKLFAKVEDEAFCASSELCALLAYRAVARELHTKSSGIDINEFLKGADRGRALGQQIAMQAFLRDYGQGLSLAEHDLNRAIKALHNAVLTDNFDGFESLVLEFDDFPLLCTTGHMPHDDWSGHVVQDLSDPKLEADWLAAISFRSGDRSWVVFTWAKGSQVIAKFVDSLLENFGNTVSDALAKYFFTVSENLAINPTWWNELSPEKREALEARISDGLPLKGGPNITAPRKGEPIVTAAALLSTRRV